MRRRLFIEEKLLGEGFELDTIADTDGRGAGKFANVRDSWDENLPHPPSTDQSLPYANTSAIGASDPPISRWTGNVTAVDSPVDVPEEPEPAIAPGDSPNADAEAPTAHRARDRRPLRLELLLRKRQHDERLVDIHG